MSFVSRQRTSKTGSMNNIAPKGDPLYNFSDNSKYRGTWDVWLRDTVLSEDRNDLLAICKSIRNFAAAAKCNKCRKHAYEYIEKNPPEKKTKDKQKFFKYLVVFMNEIQKRNGKKLYSYDILYQTFTDRSNDLCTKSCDEDDSDNGLGRDNLLNQDNISDDGLDEARKHISTGYKDENSYSDRNRQRERVLIRGRDSGNRKRAYYAGGRPKRVSITRLELM